MYGLFHRICKLQREVCLLRERTESKLCQCCFSLQGEQNEQNYPLVGKSCQLFARVRRCVRDGRYGKNLVEEQPLWKKKCEAYYPS